MVVACLQGINEGSFCNDLYMALAIVLILFIVFIVVWWMERGRDK